MFVEVFLGICALLMLLGSNIAPSVLLSFFIIASTVIYSLSSMSFLTKGIDRSLPLKASLKDWIKVNAFVTIAFVVINLFSAIYLLASPQLINQLIRSFLDQNSINLGSGELNAASLIKTTQYCLVGQLVYVIILMIHIIMTFKLVKKYETLFKDLRK